MSPPFTFTLTSLQQDWLIKNTAHMLWDDAARAFNERFETSYTWQELRDAWWAKNIPGGMGFERAKL
jgi:hypothetical protein